MRQRTVPFLSLAVCLLVNVALSQDRKTKVLNDRDRTLQDGFWIYNNVAKGQEEAKRTGKPLLVIFRCIPCEACAQLDEQVVENNPTVRKQLSQFVCVRVVHTNGMDMARFQFDYDQSWAAFFMNGDGTIYGRYGTRSHQHDSEQDVSLAGFLDTLNEVVQLHREYPSNKDALSAKTGPQPEVSRPEEFPKLKVKYSAELDYQGKVVESCIHCHQVGEAIREWHRDSGKTIPVEVMYPYPHPKILGLVMNPAKAATIAGVVAGSVAEKVGFQDGDKVLVLDGQPVVSVADIQWVLHRSGTKPELKATVQRGGKSVSVDLVLPGGWRESGDIAWRATSWALRRMVTGGLLLEPLSNEERRTQGLETNAIGLRVKHVGQFGAHAAAKRAGFKVGDILISIDGVAGPMSESQLFAKLFTTKRTGDHTTVVIAREAKRHELELPIQE